MTDEIVSTGKPYSISHVVIGRGIVALVVASIGWISMVGVTLLMLFCLVALLPALMNFLRRRPEAKVAFVEAGQGTH